MHPRSFTIGLIVSCLLALWGLRQMLFFSRPNSNENVAIVLLLLFVATASLFALLSHHLLSRFMGGQQRSTALRHGAWAGLIVVVLPLLNWANLLRPLIVIAVLIIVVGVEALLLLRSDHAGQRRKHRA